jgi:hypothetical protein
MSDSERIEVLREQMKKLRDRVAALERDSHPPAKVEVAIEPAVRKIIQKVKEEEAW